MPAAGVGSVQAGNFTRRRGLTQAAHAEARRLKVVARRSEPRQTFTTAIEFPSVKRHPASRPVSFLLRVPEGPGSVVRAFLEGLHSLLFARVAARPARR